MIGVIKGTMRQKKEVNGLPLPIASYKSNVKGNLKSLKVAITAQQSGSGTPSPDNIRPIIGASECNVVRCGANICDEQFEIGGLSSTNGQKIVANDRLRTANYIVTKSSSFYFSSPKGAWLHKYDASYNWLGREQISADASFSLSSDVAYIRLEMYSSYGTTYNNDISINYPSTDTDYHAYTANTYTIQLGDTYYGGSLDVTNGLLTVTWVELAGGWSQYAQNNGYKAYRSTSYFQTKTSTSALCNMVNEYGSFSSASMNKNIIQLPSSQTTLAYMALDENVDVSTLQLVYELATPITVQLTPTQVEQLLINNVWCDTGDVEELIYTDRQVYYGR